MVQKRSILKLVIVVIVCFMILVIYKYFDKDFINIPDSIENYCGSKYNSKGFKFKHFVDNDSLNSKVAKVSKGGLLFNVERYYDKNNNLHFKDNYPSYLYSADIGAIMSSRVGDRVDIDFLKDESEYPELGYILDVRSLLKDKNTVLHFKFFTKEEWSDSDIISLVDSLKGVCRVDITVQAKGGVMTYFSTDEDYNLAYVNRE